MIIEDQHIIKKTKVSVAVFCYNQEATIAQTLDSILEQDFDQSWEILISDDASTDKTPDICRAYQQRHKDKIRLSLYPQNIGAMENFRVAMHTVAGEYITFCAGDDYWNNPEKLSKQYYFLKAHQDHSMIHTAYEILHLPDNRFTPAPVPAGAVPDSEKSLLLNGNFVGGLTVMIKASVVNEAFRAGVLDQGFLMEDYPLWLFATEHQKIGYLNESTGVWRKNEESLSNSRNLAKRLRFELSVGEIQQFYGKRRGMTNELKPVLDEWYRYILGRALAGKEEKIAVTCMKKLKGLGTANPRERLYAHQLLGRPLFRLRNVLKK